MAHMFAASLGVHASRWVVVVELSVATFYSLVDDVGEHFVDWLPTLKQATTVLMLCSLDYGTQLRTWDVPSLARRHFYCRDDECAVNTFLQFTINRSIQRPRVTERGKAAIAFFGCAIVALESLNVRSDFQTP